MSYHKNEKDTENIKSLQNTTEATIANKTDTIEIRMSNTANELDMRRDGISDTNNEKPKLRR
ncbi:958_t:CDS:2 [Scutellospora calospora]|uniref:958_t:CDS:1 n=1 Tax=Scutellospora calospora TaxID=85575 RepID=A0ACA9LYV0_9GLOM|nr:958_t:CDS:2 [Scutellospora calospora]